MLNSLNNNRCFTRTRTRSNKKISLSIKAMFAPEKEEAPASEDGDVVSVDIDKVIAEQDKEAAEE